MNKPEKLLTLVEATEILGLSLSTLYKYVEKSMIPHLRIGRSIRFNPSTLEMWIKSRAIPSEGKD
jgi:excisionase family DNA binding protein